MVYLSSAPNQPATRWVAGGGLSVSWTLFLCVFLFPFYAGCQSTWRVFVGFLSGESRHRR